MTVYKTIVPLFFLAHLSQRLIDELIGYSWSGIRSSPVVIVINNFKHLLQNRLPNQSQILFGVCLGRGTKVCSRHVGHMTKMAATPINGKTLQKSSPEPAGGFSRNLVCSIGDSSPS